MAVQIAVASATWPVKRRWKSDRRMISIGEKELRSSGALPCARRDCNREYLMDILLWVGVGVFVILLSGIRIAQEYQRGVLFRLGRFSGLRGPGLYWIIPLGLERAVT